MKPIHSVTALGLCLTLIACNNNLQSQNAPPNSSPINEASVSSSAGMKTSPVKALTKDDLQVFSINGTKIRDAQIGDLKGDGQTGAVIVLDPLSNNSIPPGELPERTVLLVIRDAEGNLHEVARNKKIAPCSICGGIAAGDPLSQVRINPGEFTLRMEGGSRERWWNVYTFKYAQNQNTWSLQEMESGVSDATTDSFKKKIFTPKYFGTIKFSEVDPDTLPNVDLP